MIFFSLLNLFQNTFFLASFTERICGCPYKEETNHSKPRTNSSLDKVNKDLNNPDNCQKMLVYIKKYLQQEK
jgi:hypothetical protein